MMDALHFDVQRALRSSRHPVSASEVAHAVGTRLDNVQDALGYLVRHGGAKRHHCDDAVLRYSAVVRRAARELKPVDPDNAPRAAAALCAIDAGYRRGVDIAAAISASPAYTSVILRRLQAQGLVQVTSASRGSKHWERVRRDDALPPNLAAAQRTQADDDDELPPWLGERMRDTFHDIFRAAGEAALDAEDNTP